MLVQKKPVSVKRPRVSVKRPRVSARKSRNEVVNALYTYGQEHKSIEPSWLKNARRQEPSWLKYPKKNGSSNSSFSPFAPSNYPEWLENANARLKLEQLADQFENERTKLQQLVATLKKEAKRRDDYIKWTTQRLQLYKNALGRKPNKRLSNMFKQMNLANRY